MARQLHKLTALQVDSLTKAGRYGDGNGLYLNIKPSGTKSWVQRLTIHGKMRDTGLGGYPLTTLAEARDKAAANMKAARAGGDPLADKRQARIAATEHTFEAVARRFVDENKATWRNAKHAKQWGATLETYAFPVIGRMPVDKIGPQDIKRVLMQSHKGGPLWHTVPETASRLKQRMGRVMLWSIANGLAEYDPVAAISAGLPKQTQAVKHHRSIDYMQAQAAIEAVTATAAFPTTKLAFEFLVLTAARSGEARGATWAEVDIEAATWTIAANRMKAGRAHRVPLSDRALAILQEAMPFERGPDSLVFPAPRGGIVSDATIGKLLRESNIDAVPHGFRTTFRTWVQDMTNTPLEVAEAALAHVKRDKVEAAYARSDVFEKRRALMRAWSDYLAGQASDAKVIALR